MNVPAPPLTSMKLQNRGNSNESMDSERIVLSVIIVTWNARDYTLQCLKSLQAQGNALSTEIIIVDNASSDGTPESVKRAFPHVRVVQNETNLGFAKANNIGMQLSRGQYICLINSDVNVPPGCLVVMHAYMEKKPEVGVLGPRMRGRDGHVGRSYMRFPTLWRMLCNSLAFSSLPNASSAFSGTMMTEFMNNHTAEVDVLNGWFLMVRRKALEEVGLLDERFFMYGEDIDWSYRFHENGWKRVYFAGAEAVHYGGASSANAPTRFYIEMQKANIQFWKKYNGRLSQFTFLMTVWLHQVIRVLGYGALFCVRGAACHGARIKVRRSFACLRWLSSVRP